MSTDFDVAVETPLDRALRGEKSAAAAGFEDVLTFHALCAADKYEAVRKALKKGQDPNARDHFNRTALHAACLHGHADIVSLLCKAEAEPDVVENVDGCTPLHLAALNGNEACVALLLQRGADADLQDKRGLTPMMIAAQSRNEAVLGLLVDQTESPELVDSRGWSILHYTAWRGMADSTETLLEKGGDPRLKAKDGARARDLAEACGHGDVVDVFVKWYATHNVGAMVEKLT